MGIGVDPNLVLTRYEIERYLYRLSRSPYADRFVLKANRGTPARPFPEPPLRLDHVIGLGQPVRAARAKEASR